MTNAQALLQDLISELYGHGSHYNLRFSKFSKNYLIYSQDGQLLGNCGWIYDSDSIFNRYGEYGNRYSDKCIFNIYSPYGSKYSDLSPYNKYSSAPPIIRDENNRLIGSLTMNKYVNNAIDPNSFIVKAAKDMDLTDRLPDLIRDY